MNMKLQKITKMLQDEVQLHIDTMKKIEQELVNQEENLEINKHGIIVKNNNGETVLTMNQGGIWNRIKEKEENETDKFINFLLDLEKRITKLENNKLDNDIKNISNKVAENIFNNLKRMDKNINIKEIRLYI